MRVLAKVRVLIVGLDRVTIPFRCILGAACYKGRVRIRVGGRVRVREGTRSGLGWMGSLFVILPVIKRAVRARKGLGTGLGLGLALRFCTPGVHLEGRVHGQQHLHPDYERWLVRVSVRVRTMRMTHSIQRPFGTPVASNLDPSWALSWPGSSWSQGHTRVQVMPCQGWGNARFRGCVAELAMMTRKINHSKGGHLQSRSHAALKVRG